MIYETLSIILKPGYKFDDELKRKIESRLNKSLIYILNGSIPEVYENTVRIKVFFEYGADTLLSKNSIKRLKEVHEYKFIRI